MTLPIVPETHQEGDLSVENSEVIEKILDESHLVDFGLQTSEDGRVWVCINGIAWIRFKPITNKGAE